jgi:hypothetical protein
LTSDNFRLIIDFRALIFNYPNVANTMKIKH